MEGAKAGLGGLGGVSNVTCTSGQIYIEAGLPKG